MTVSPISRFCRRPVVCAAGLGILVSAAAMVANAQPVDPATSAPRSLLPPPVGVSEAPPLQGGQPARGQPLAPGRQLPAMPAPVNVDELGTVEGPIAGTMNDFNGGLGQDMWEESDRAEVEMLLERIPATLPSPTSRLLFRKILLTEAVPPVGASDVSFNALRIRKLLEAGELEDAGALAADVRSRDPETQRMQADAMLYAGRDIELCGEATDHRLESAEQFWVDLRAYCYHFDGNELALELTRSVMEQQGMADPALFYLLDQIDSEEPEPPDGIADPNAVHIRLLQRLELPVPASAVTTLGMPLTVIAATSENLPPEVRRPAAERAFQAGVLPSETLAELFDGSAFPPEELRLAATLARSEPPMVALERIYTALEVEGNAARRAELVHLAFQIGRGEGMLPQVAGLFADFAAEVIPAPNWEAWSPLMIRGLLLAGERAAAERWYEILNPLIPEHFDSGADGALVLGLVTGDEIYVSDAQGALADLAIQVSDPVAPPDVQARAALFLGLYEALGIDMPFEALAEVERLVRMDYPGRTPARVLMQRIDAASLDGRQGELALGILEAMGPRGPGDMSPSVVVRFVRALQTAGMNETAYAVAREAVLARQGT